MTSPPAPNHVQTLSTFDPDLGRMPPKTLHQGFALGDDQKGYRAPLKSTRQGDDPRHPPIRGGFHTASAAPIPKRH